MPKIESPSVKLEQYTTPAELVLAMLKVPLFKGLIEDATVADLGSGTCRIAIASLLLGARRAIAVDYDYRFGSICKLSAEKLGVSEGLAFVSAWIAEYSGPLRQGLIDLVIMNPPFGVWRRGADREFLEYAMSLNAREIVALVKSGNLEFHAGLAKARGYSFNFLGTHEFPIPAAMPHHRSRIRRIKVDLVELSRS
ncbi:MAG: METTL5 family protein [Acidilobus sp.]